MYFGKKGATKSYRGILSKKFELGAGRISRAPIKMTDFAEFLSLGAERFGAEGCSGLCLCYVVSARRRPAREDIKDSSPRLSGVISDCVGLARIILNQIVR